MRRWRVESMGSHLVAEAVPFWALLSMGMGCAGGAVLTSDPSVDTSVSGQLDTGRPAAVSDSDDLPVSTDTVAAGETGTGTDSSMSLDTGTHADTDTDTDLAPVDYREVGPHSVLTGAGSVVTSCTMRYTTFLPAGGAPDALVVLSHGFARGSAQMRAWAEHFASWGLAVVTPDLCHLSLIDVDHGQNATDLANLAESLMPGQPVIYAGHSAGALSSVIAATLDPDAMAVFGLDLTDDFDGTGLAAASDLTVPLWALEGDREVCNSFGNGRDVVAAAAEGRAVHLYGSDHCDFENPTNFLCTIACSDGAEDSEQVRELIHGLATAYLVWKTGLDPAGADWWTPGGSFYDALEGTRFEEVSF